MMEDKKIEDDQNAGKVMQVGDSQNIDNEEEDIYYWKSFSEHLIIFFLYVVTWNGGMNCFYENGVKAPKIDPTFLHFATVILVVGTPLLYLQNFLGQYTRKGCFTFGEMVPLAYGFGFTMMVQNFFQFIIQIHYTFFLIFYFFSSLVNNEPPWIVCFARYWKSTSKCFSGRDIDFCPRGIHRKPCFVEGTKIFSSVLYMQQLNMHANIEPKEIILIRSHSFDNLLNEIFHTVVITVILIIIAPRNTKNLGSTFRSTFYLTISVTMCLFVIALIRPGGILGLNVLWQGVSLKSLTARETWSAAFRRVLNGLKLAEGGVITFATLIPPSKLFPYRTLQLTLVYMSLIFCNFLLFFTFQGRLIFKMTMDSRAVHFISEEGVIFGLFATILGVHAYGNLFCLIYFLLMTVLSLLSMVVQVIVMEKTLSLQFNKMTYYGYIRIFIIFFAAITSFYLIYPVDLYDIYRFQYNLKISMLAIVAGQILIVQFYGIQRICDDIEFYLLKKVSILVKLSWYLTLVWCAIELFESKKLNFYDHLPWITYFFIIIYSAPITFCLIYIGIRFAKKKKLIKLFHPMNEFGHPNIRMKIYRILYNPRLAVKYKRQTYVCFHDCLLNSKALKKAIKEEVDLMENLITELKMNKNEESAQDAEMITILEKHHKILKQKQIKD